MRVLISPFLQQLVKAKVTTATCEPTLDIPIIAMGAHLGFYLVRTNNLTDPNRGSKN